MCNQVDSSLVMVYLIFILYINLFRKKEDKVFYKIQVEMVKTHLDQTYNLSTFKD